MVTSGDVFNKALMAYHAQPIREAQRPEWRPAARTWRRFPWPGQQSGDLAARCANLGLPRLRLDNRIPEKKQTGLFLHANHAAWG